MFGSFYGIFFLTLSNMCFMLLHNFVDPIKTNLFGNAKENYCKVKKIMQPKAWADSSEKV